ncbi:hypothetical protein BCR33DRAFT_484207 [Rhizoclosmatium globosum]|uniref:Uncharacterized protein n=1 Tax=Rhizoclosmatium globosum TaxID=329046 RepID=A0A1Y2BMY0_9FUNG|nr:hypothetical protein BCR33DRAFT_484207 [Rhizoclosmatium globosum]|eukprot:ORY36121.1 hypothetical protein BCR33DRAFT_484207 [Rhizoclosmatium globosum]
MLGVNNSGVRRSDGRLNSLGTENDDHGGPGSNSGNSGEHPQTRRGSDYVQLQQFKGPVKSLGALNGANGGAERRSITHHGGVPAIQQRAMELDVFTRSITAPYEIDTSPQAQAPSVLETPQSQRHRAVTASSTSSNNSTQPSIAQPSSLLTAHQRTSSVPVPVTIPPTYSTDAIPITTSPLSTLPSCASALSLMPSASAVDLPHSSSCLSSQNPHVAYAQSLLSHHIHHPFHLLSRHAPSSQQQQQQQQQQQAPSTGPAAGRHSSGLQNQTGSNHSFDLSQPSGVTPPPGMALLYDPKAILGPWRGPSLIVGSVTDSVEQPDSNSGTTRSTGGGTQKSNSTNSAGSGMYGNAGGPNRSIDEESNDGTGGSNNPNNNPDSSNAASAVPRKPAKCTCESHEGLQIVNQVLPHGLRMLVEKLTKEEGSRVLQDAYNACGSDGIVFWRWNVGEDGKRSSRVVEYTARFAGFMNAEPILCKEYQQVLSSNDDCVVMDVKVESAQKFDIGNIHRSISFTNRICLTYEDTQKLRIKVHSHMNDSQGTGMYFNLLV